MTIWLLLLLAQAPPGPASSPPAHTNSFHEALALPTEHAARIALRAQQILASEAGTTDTADPLAGSYFVESLTEGLEQRARELIVRVDDLGGAGAAIEQGFVQAEIEASAFRYQTEVESGERVVVGVNRFAEEGSEHVELLHVDPEIERRQRERIARVRAERDAAAAESTLAEVRRVAGTDANLLPPMREALRAIIRNEDEMNKIREYIKNNPLKWSLDRENPEKIGTDVLEDEIFRHIRNKGELE